MEKSLAHTVSHFSAARRKVQCSNSAGEQALYKRLARTLAPRTQRGIRNWVCASVPRASIAGEAAGSYSCGGGDVDPPASGGFGGGGNDRGGGGRGGGDQGGGMPEESSGGQSGFFNVMDPAIAFVIILYQVGSRAFRGVLVKSIVPTIYHSPVQELNHRSEAPPSSSSNPFRYLGEIIPTFADKRSPSSSSLPSSPLSSFPIINEILEHTKKLASMFEVQDISETFDIKTGTATTIMALGFGESAKITVRLPIDARNRQLIVGPSEVVLSAQTEKPNLNIDFSTNNAMLNLKVLQKEDIDMKLVFSSESILPAIESAWILPNVPHVNSATVKAKVATHQRSIVLSACAQKDFKNGEIATQFEATTKCSLKGTSVFRTPLWGWNMEVCATLSPLAKPFANLDAVMRKSFMT